MKLIWVCSPGNPTAVALNRHGIVRLLDSFDGMVVVDEAYVDFIQTENTSSTGTSNGNVEWDGVGDHPSVNERLDRLLSVGTEKKGSMVPFLSRYPRLVVLQTLSKSFGLAGLRYNDSNQYLYFSCCYNKSIDVYIFIFYIYIFYNKTIEAYMFHADTMN